ncbi:hypothetical protein ACTQ54_11965 [Fundicoccus sp. Sow4_H7]|uniref:hypothetical protein n=1 Tax=Fundicoccus sp. Sow4_H7 TaxID=3438784 RepID=UPI003F901C8A
MVREILALGVFILKNAENSVADAKYVIDRGFEMSLEEGLELEVEFFGQQYDHTNQGIGVKAFSEKKRAEFQNK